MIICLIRQQLISKAVELRSQIAADADIWLVGIAAGWLSYLKKLSAIIILYRMYIYIYFVVLLVILMDTENVCCL